MPQLLRGGRELSAWVLAGGAAERAPRAWRWQLRWQAMWFERLWKLQHERIANPRPLNEPVFILGLWRSGTTLLHEWVSRLEGLASPATWQCFSPASFALTGPPSDLARALPRPMDGGEVRPGSPQEDEFALLLLGADSLYRGFIDPRRLAELLAAQRDDADAHTPWVARWLRFLAGVEAAAGRRLVLKSPNHSLRVATLQAVFPQARWIWIGRPAVQVWHSNLRMWRAMFATYALWKEPPGALEAFLAGCIEQYIERLDWARRHVDPRLVRWVDFGDLYAEPEALLASLCGHLALPEPAQRGALHDIVRARPAVAAASPADAPAQAGIVRLLQRLDEAQAECRRHWAAS